jgi:hypothetical protein
LELILDWLDQEFMVLDVAMDAMDVIKLVDQLDV